MPGGRIFLSYRRDDSAGHAGRLYDRLNARFPGRIFMDVSGIAPGVDFVEEIERAVGSCQVLIVLIGKDWLDIKDEAGRRRLDHPGDFVRLEVATGLKRKIRVIPTLVRDAHMPSAEVLPPDLAALARRNALEVNDHDFDHDAERLIETLETELGEPSRQPLTVTDEEQRKARHFARLREQAQAALSVEDWMTAIQSLQAALSLNPNDAETAAQLRRAHEQQKLAALFSRCQKLYENGDKQGALGCFRQVRVAGGNYKNVNSLITMMQTETAPLSSPLPAATERRGFGWLFGVLAGVVVLGALGLGLFVWLLSNSVAVSPQPQTVGPSSANTSVSGQALSPANQPATESEESSDFNGQGTTAAAAFEPVGRWLITQNSSAIGPILHLNADHTFTLEAETDGLSVPAGSGRWDYDAAKRTLRLTGTDFTGDSSTETIRIGEQHEDHYHISAPELGNANMTRQP